MHLIDAEEGGMLGFILFTAILFIYGILMSGAIWLPFVPDDHFRRRMKAFFGRDSVRLPASWIAIVAGVWNIFAPDFGGMNSPTVLGSLIPSVMLIIDGVIICPESVRIINIPKRVRDRWVFRILRLEKAAGPATILIAVLHAAFSDALLF